MAPRRHHGRKLLVASIGVATLNYVGLQCGGTTTESSDGGGVTDAPIGNLVARDVGGPDLNVPDTNAADTNLPDANGPDTKPADANASDRSVRDVVEDFPVANLVAFPPDAIDDFPVANLVALPPDSGGHDAKE
jgi:hypothetical protein